MTAPELITTKWRKSSRSGGGNACVEVALQDSPSIRDSKNRTGSNLNIEPACWSPFLAVLKAGRFDR